MISGTQIVGAPQGILMQTFSTTGVWTKPVGRILAKVTVIGAGGGGASGTIWRTKTGVANNAPGGQAGYQGFRFTQTFLMSELPAAVTCTVGVGGAGGTRATLGAATTPGTYQRSNAGSTGGNSQFGSLIFAQGNGGGPQSAPTAPTLPYDAGSAGWYGGYGGSSMYDGVTTPVGLVGQNAPDSGAIPGGAGGTSGSEAAGNGKPGRSAWSPPWLAVLVVAAGWGGRGQPARLPAPRYRWGRRPGWRWWRWGCWRLHGFPRRSVPQRCRWQGRRRRHPGHFAMRQEEERDA